MEDLSYLNVEYPYLVIQKEDLIKILNLTSKIVRINSTQIESSSISFIPANTHINIAISNDLTYFNCKVEILGSKNDIIKEPFSIKYELLNKLKPYYKDKILIYKKGLDFYLRLIDGDLLIDTKTPDLSRLAFTSSIHSLIYECNISKFYKILNYYKNVAYDYSDRWVCFDESRLSITGNNFFSCTNITTPRMCILNSDIELICKLEQYYSESCLKFYSTSNNSTTKLHLQIDNIDIEILNVLSNMNISNIDNLYKYISDKGYYINSDFIKRVLNLASSLSNIEKFCEISIKDNKMTITVSHSKGKSDFSVDIGDTVDKIEARLNIQSLFRIMNAIQDEQVRIDIQKLYTTIASESVKSIILNC